MRLRHIEVFQAVYSTGSMTQAAALLNVSQPSVSKVLAHAEIQLGFRLFERTRGKLQPTPEAIRLYPHVAALFEDLGEVRRVAANLRDAADGRLRIASTPALGLELVPRVVASFMASTPDVIVEIETLHHSQIATALIESRIDIGLAFDPGPTPGIAQEPLGTGELVLIAPVSMTLNRRARFAMQHLSNLPLIQLNRRSPLGGMIQTYFDTLGVKPNVVAVAETYHIAKSLVMNGVGVALVDEITAQSEPRQGLQQLSISPELKFTISLLRLADTPVARLTERFVQHLRTQIEPLSLVDGT